mgnify:CR=1 FL=1|jgi:hypothetical protein
MKKAVYLGMFAALAAATVLAAASWGQEQATGDVQAVSWDNWRTAKAKAEEYDNAGKYAEALQYYLEYARQAEGLARPELVAWGKNNAAYMIIKMHKQDPTIDLAPAKKLLEEGQAIDAATDDCKQVLATNMEYVKLFLRRPTP